MSILSQMFVIAVVGFSNCKSLHLSSLVEYPPPAFFKYLQSLISPELGSKFCVTCIV